MFSPFSVKIYFAKLIFYYYIKKKKLIDYHSWSLEYQILTHSSYLFLASIESSNTINGLCS